MQPDPFISLKIACSTFDRCGRALLRCNIPLVRTVIAFRLPCMALDAAKISNAQRKTTRFLTVTGKLFHAGCARRETAFGERQPGAPLVNDF